MKFSVWQTSIAVLEFMRQERRLVARYGALPLILSFVVKLAVGGLVAALTLKGEGAMDNTTNAAILLAQSAAQLIILLPVTVFCLRLSVIGEDAAAGRPIFQIGRVEWQFLRLQLKAMAGYLGILAIIVGGALLLSRPGERGQPIFTILALLWLIGGAVGILMVLMRISMAFVASALDQPMTFRQSWNITRGYGWRLLGANGLLAIAGVAIYLLFLLVGFIFGAAGVIVSAQKLQGVLAGLQLVGSSLANFLILLATATLFGFVYRMLIAPPASAESPN